MSPAKDDAPSGRATDSGNAASTAEVRAMFDKIARVYDPMNLVISAFQEPRWRKRAVKLTGAKPGDRILDVATGTGKVAADLHAKVAAGRERPRSRHLTGDDPRRAEAVRRPAGTHLRRRRCARTADRGRHVRRGHDRLRDAQPAGLRQGVLGARTFGPARRPCSLPRDRPAEESHCPDPAVLVRQDRADRRSGRRPGRRTATSSGA